MNEEQKEAFIGYFKKVNETQIFAVNKKFQYQAMGVREGLIVALATMGYIVEYDDEMPFHNVIDIRKKDEKNNEQEE